MAVESHSVDYMNYHKIAYSPSNLRSYSPTGLSWEILLSPLHHSTNYLHGSMFSRAHYIFIHTTETTRISTQAHHKKGKIENITS